MSKYDEEVFRLLCNTLGSIGAPGTFALRTELNGQLLPAMTALATTENILSAFDDALVVRHGADVAREIRAVCAVRQETNRRRNLAIRQAVLELGNAAAAEGFTLAVLKGAAWVLEDDERAAAWRWMIDIDVLVDQQRFASMPAILRRLGYEQISDDARFEVNFHLAPFAKPDDPASLEVHRHLGWRHELLPPPMVFDSAREVAPGLVVPAPWCRAYHALIHWQVHDFGKTRATVPLKEMVEVDRFLRRADVDWEVLAAHARGNGTARACEAAIALTATLLGAPAPNAMPLTAFGRRHVALALARKMSPWRTWLAREKWRAATLWRCEKIAYRSAIRGASSATTTAAVWTGRLVRLPVLLSRTVAVLVRALAMLLSERFQQKYLTRLAGASPHVMPATELPAQKS
ncbi:MAG: nucleotidyltransferase family protein [Xanthobacteraceae bacterium]|jgi:hypothetical protein